MAKEQELQRVSYFYKQSDHFLILDGSQKEAVKLQFALLRSGQNKRDRTQKRGWP